MDLLRDHQDELPAVLHPLGVRHVVLDLLGDWRGVPSLLDVSNNALLLLDDRRGVLPLLGDRRGVLLLLGELYDVTPVFV